MPWNPDDFTRPQADLLARTRRRGEQLRHRRRLTWALCLPVLLLAIAVPAAIARQGSDRGTTLAAVGRAAGPTTTTPTPAPSPATTAMATEEPSTSAPARLFTTTTTSAPGPTTTEPPPPTTTTVMLPLCTPASFSAKATVDKAMYKPGDTVTLTVAYTNTSGRTCDWGSPQSGLTVLDASGHDWGPHTTSIADSTGPPSPVTPGASKTETVTWDQKDCFTTPSVCTQAPPGTYTIIWTTSSFGQGQATFQLVAGP